MSDRRKKKKPSWLVGAEERKSGQHFYLESVDRLEGKDLEMVIKIISYMSSRELTSIDLGGINLDLSGLELVVQSLMHCNNKIDVLNMNSSGICDQGFTVLVELLSRVQITEIDLSSNNITDDGLLSVVQALPHPQLLHKTVHVDLSFNKIESSDLICEFASYSGILGLSISDNDVDSLSNFQSDLPNLRYLCISNSQEGWDSILDLAPNLQWINGLSTDITSPLLDPTFSKEPDGAKWKESYTALAKLRESLSGGSLIDDQSDDYQESLQSPSTNCSDEYSSSNSSDVKPDLYRRTPDSRLSDAQVPQRPDTQASSYCSGGSKRGQSYILNNISNRPPSTPISQDTEYSSDDVIEVRQQQKVNKRPESAGTRGSTSRPSRPPSSSKQREMRSPDDVRDSVKSKQSTTSSNRNKHSQSKKKKYSSVRYSSDSSQEQKKTSKKKSRKVKPLPTSSEESEPDNRNGNQSKRSTPIKQKKSLHSLSSDNQSEDSQILEQKKQKQSRSRKASSKSKRKPPPSVSSEEYSDDSEPDQKSKKNNKRGTPIKQKKPPQSISEDFSSESEPSNSKRNRSTPIKKVKITSEGMKARKNSKQKQTPPPPPPPPPDSSEEYYEDSQDSETYQKPSNRKKDRNTTVNRKNKKPSQRTSSLESDHSQPDDKTRRKIRSRNASSKSKRKPPPSVSSEEYSDDSEPDQKSKKKNKRSTPIKQKKPPQSISEDFSNESEPSNSKKNRSTPIKQNNYSSSSESLSEENKKIEERKKKKNRNTSKPKRKQLPSVSSESYSSDGGHINNTKKDNTATPQKRKKQPQPQIDSDSEGNQKKQKNSRTPVKQINQNTKKYPSATLKSKRESVPSPESDAEVQSENRSKRQQARKKKSASPSRSKSKDNTRNHSVSSNSTDEVRKNISNNKSRRESGIKQQKQKSSKKKKNLQKEESCPSEGASDNNNLCVSSSSLAGSQLEGRNSSSHHVSELTISQHGEELKETMYSHQAEDTPQETPKDTSSLRDEETTDISTKLISEFKDQPDLDTKSNISCEQNNSDGRDVAQINSEQEFDYREKSKSQGSLKGLNDNNQSQNELINTPLGHETEPDDASQLVDSATLIQQEHQESDTQQPEHHYEGTVEKQLEDDINPQLLQSQEVLEKDKSDNVLEVDEEMSQLNIDQTPLLEKGILEDHPNEETEKETSQLPQPHEASEAVADEENSQLNTNQTQQEDQSHEPMEEETSLQPEPHEASEAVADEENSQLNTNQTQQEDQSHEPMEEETSLQPEPHEAAEAVADEENSQLNTNQTQQEDQSHEPMEEETSLQPEPHEAAEAVADEENSQLNTNQTQQEDQSHEPMEEEISPQPEPHEASEAAADEENSQISTSETPANEEGKPEDTSHEAKEHMSPTSQSIQQTDGQVPQLLPATDEVEVDMDNSELNTNQTPVPEDGSLQGLPHHAKENMNSDEEKEISDEEPHEATAEVKSENVSEVDVEVDEEISQIKPEQPHVHETVGDYPAKDIEIPDGDSQVTSQDIHQTDNQQSQTHEDEHIKLSDNQSSETKEEMRETFEKTAPQERTQSDDTDSPVMKNGEESNPDSQQEEEEGTHNGDLNYNKQLQQLNEDDDHINPIGDQTNEEENEESKQQFLSSHAEEEQLTTAKEEGSHASTSDEQLQESIEEQSCTHPHPHPHPDDKQFDSCSQSSTNSHHTNTEIKQQVDTTSLHTVHTNHEVDVHPADNKVKPSNDEYSEEVVLQQDFTEQHETQISSNGNDQRQQQQEVLDSQSELDINFSEDHSNVNEVEKTSDVKQNEESTATQVESLPINHQIEEVNKDTPDDEHKQEYNEQVDQIIELPNNEFTDQVGTSQPDDRLIDINHQSDEECINEEEVEINMCGDPAVNEDNSSVWSTASSFVKKEQARVPVGLEASEPKKGSHQGDIDMTSSTWSTSSSFIRKENIERDATQEFTEDVLNCVSPSADDKQENINKVTTSQDLTSQGVEEEQTQIATLSESALDDLPTDQHVEHQQQQKIINEEVIPLSDQQVSVIQHVEQEIEETQREEELMISCQQDNNNIPIEDEEKEHPSAVEGSEFRVIPLEDDKQDINNNEQQQQQKEEEKLPNDEFQQQPSNECQQDVLPSNLREDIVNHITEVRESQESKTPQQEDDNLPAIELVEKNYQQPSEEVQRPEKTILPTPTGGQLADDKESDTKTPPSVIGNEVIVEQSATPVDVSSVKCKEIAQEEISAAELNNNNDTHNVVTKPDQFQSKEDMEVADVLRHDEEGNEEGLLIEGINMEITEPVIEKSSKRLVQDFKACLSLSEGGLMKSVRQSTPTVCPEPPSQSRNKRQRPQASRSVLRSTTPSTSRQRRPQSAHCSRTRQVNSNRSGQSPAGVPLLRSVDGDSPGDLYALCPSRMTIRELREQSARTSVCYSYFLYYDNENDL